MPTLLLFATLSHTCCVVIAQTEDNLVTGLNVLNASVGHTENNTFDQTQKTVLSKLKLHISTS